MASLADVVDDTTMDDVDDAPMEETSDMDAAVAELASVLGVSDDKIPALKSAMEAVILSTK